jgi:O-antigen/teichoic acid export membrane protein
MMFTADERSFPNPKPRAALVAYKALADAAAKGALFLVTVAAARRLSPDSFGVFALGSTIGWMAAVAADFGIQLHLARVVAQRPDEAPANLWMWLRIRCWTAAAALAVIAAGLAVVRTPFATAGAILVLALVYAIGGLVELLHHFYRGLSRTDIESSVVVAQRLGTLVCGLAALAWRPTVGTLGAALLAPVLVSFVVSLRIAYGLAQRAQRHTRPLSKSGMEFLRDVVPIGAGIVLSAIYFRIDVLLVQAWDGTRSVALYNGVFRLVEALRLFPAALLAVTLPMLCRTREWRPLIEVSAAVTAFAIVVTFPLWQLADSIVPLLYGDAFRPAAPAFRILMISFPLMSLNYALTHQLIGWNGQRAYAAVCAAALVVNVALNARLIPALSIVGAAWATLVTELVVTAGCAIALVVRASERVDRLLDDRPVTDHAVGDGALT